jgi:hypothetical protein
MWDRGREELSWLFSPEDWLKGWTERVKQGRAVAFGNHAILGWDFESPGVICTSFQAARSFEAAGKQVTKELRREIPRLMKQHGVDLVCTYSLCVAPDAAKWFRLLGLEEDTSYRGIKRGPYVSRRFIRRA